MCLPNATFITLSVKFLLLNESSRNTWGMTAGALYTTDECGLSKHPRGPKPGGVEEPPFCDGWTNPVNGLLLFPWGGYLEGKGRSVREDSGCFAIFS